MLGTIESVGAAMIILLVLEGAVVFLGASVYVWRLIRQVRRPAAPHGRQQAQHARAHGAAVLRCEHSC